MRVACKACPAVRSILVPLVHFTRTPPVFPLFSLFDHSYKKSRTSEKSNTNQIKNTLCWCYI